MGDQKNKWGSFSVMWNLLIHTLFYLFCFHVHLRYSEYHFHPQGKQNNIASLEMETWHDLANVYTSLSQWRDAEICLSKSEAINPHSASRLHSAGRSCFI